MMFGVIGWGWEGSGYAMSPSKDVVAINYLIRLGEAIEMFKLHAGEYLLSAVS